MASCKDCLYVEVCKDYAINYLKTNNNTPMEALEKEVGDYPCCHFQDRSLFVKLPCKVYTTFLGRVLEAKIYGYEASIKNSNSSWTIEPQHFGKYVFFTYEEAEQALNKTGDANA